MYNTKQISLFYRWLVHYYLYNFVLLNMSMENINLSKKSNIFIFPISW